MPPRRIRSPLGIVTRPRPIDCARCGQLHHRCAGHKDEGGLRPCAAWPIKGAEVCGAHGGRAPQVKQKAAERVLEGEAQKANDRYLRNSQPVADPLTALLEIAGEITGFKDFLAGRLADLGPESWRYEGVAAEQLRAEVALYERALDRTAKVLVDINKLGLEERQTRLAERQSNLLHATIARVLAALDLTPEQEALVPVVVPRELRANKGGA